MKAVVVGYGAMGKLLSQMLGDELASVVAIECENKKIDDVKENFDVIIDFSNPANLDMICDYVSKTKKPVVFATTGYTEEQLKKIDDLSKVAPVLRSANFSLGVAKIFFVGRLVFQTLHYIILTKSQNLSNFFQLFFIGRGSCSEPLHITILTKPQNLSTNFKKNRRMSSS